jgi:PPOX class probable F420-dependent enzyme
MALTRAQREFLEDPRFAVLATVMPDGGIQQTVMWYQFRGDSIMMNTKAGRVKHSNIHRDPRVSVCFEDGYRYLTIQGRVVETIDDQEIAQADILSLARRYHPHRPEEEHSYFKEEQRETLLISIDSVIANGF